MRVNGDILSCLLLLSNVMITLALPSEIYIAVIVSIENENDEKVVAGVQEEIMSNPQCSSQTTVKLRAISVYPKDSFKAMQELCKLAEQLPLTAVVALQPSEVTSRHMESVCANLRLPYIKTFWTSPFTGIHDIISHSYSISLYPTAQDISMAYVDLIKEWAVDQFVVIYEDELGLVRMQDVLTQFAPPKHNVYLAQLPNDARNDFKPFLKKIKRALIRHLVIDCRIELVSTILQQAEEIGMINDYYSYMFTTMDLHLVDLTSFQKKQGRVNITALQILDDDWQNQHHCVRNNVRWTPGHRLLSTSYSLVYDAVHMIIGAVERADSVSRLSFSRKECGQKSNWRSNESSIMQQLQTEMHGRTGRIRLNQDGHRQEVQLKVIELSKDGLVKVGTWYRQTGVNYTRTWGQKKDEIATSMANRTFVVVVAVAKPYVMKTNNSLGEAVYSGFCIDLMKEIASKKKFNVSFIYSEKNAYGTYDEKTGPTGMIKKLMQNEADMAIADLSITLERERGVDFSMPWMNLGISILYRKPSKPAPQLFSFLHPLSPEVWIYMGTAYLGVSVLLFILARLSPDEWDNPNPCIEEPDVLENQFTLLNSLWFTIGSLMQQGSDIAPKLSPCEWQEPSVCSMAGAEPDFQQNEMNLRNSFWFTIGSLMQQGCDINPKAISTRMVATWWWIFTLIMISSYTANLAAFLTANRMETPIKSAEDLAKQTTIKYGCVKSGASRAFFRGSDKDHYQRMYNFMETARPSVYVSTTKEGVRRVQKGNYAFLMESSSIEYYLERDCDLTQIGGLLDHKSYGIALQPGSPYTHVINSAILEIQEEGTLLKLKNLWWKKKDGPVCSPERSAMDNDLGIDNVGGVFIVLIAGMGFSVLIAIGEFIWKSRKLANEGNTSLLREMSKELRFALSCGGSTKPMTKPEQIRPVTYHHSHEDYITYATQSDK